MALGSTQSLAEMSTRNLPGSKGWLVRKADKLTAICELHEDSYLCLDTQIHFGSCSVHRMDIYFNFVIVFSLI
jgi:hypothetical protein